MKHFAVRIEVYPALFFIALCGYEGHETSEFINGGNYTKTDREKVTCKGCAI